MPSFLPEEEDVVSNLAQRFRKGGAFGASIKAQSLDQQELDKEVPSAQLADFVLDALDSVQDPSHDRNDYVLEEVNADAPSPDRSGPRGRRSLVDPTQGKADGLSCPHCGASNPPGMRFCVQCGGSLQVAAKAPASARGAAPNRQPPPPSEAAKQANPWEIALISINEDGSDGAAIALEFLETTVGREGDARFPTDAFLSPKHARLHIEKGELFIEDLYSLNGTFLKLREEVRLTPGDTFLMGRQVLRFERFEQPISPKTKSSDGTRYMGSPAPGGSYKILQIGIGGIIQNIYCLPETGAVLGREKGDIIFPHDKFMSSRHAQIYTGDDGHCYLMDLTSSNGTWIKIWEKTRLRQSDYIFMGQQLFRVHLKESRR
jgi:pSer/pThr/pTyr-binding forkhead associated (FHA) protein